MNGSDFLSRFEETIGAVIYEPLHPELKVFDMVVHFFPPLLATPLDVDIFFPNSKKWLAEDWQNVEREGPVAWRMSLFSKQFCDMMTAEMLNFKLCCRPIQLVKSLLPPPSRKQTFSYWKSSECYWSVSGWVRMEGLHVAIGGKAERVSVNKAPQHHPWIQLLLHTSLHIEWRFSKNILVRTKADHNLLYLWKTVISLITIKQIWQSTAVWTPILRVSFPSNEFNVVNPKKVGSLSLKFQRFGSPTRLRSPRGRRRRLNHSRSFPQTINAFTASRHNLSSRHSSRRNQAFHKQCDIRPTNPFIA